MSSGAEEKNNMPNIIMPHEKYDFLYRKEKELRKKECYEMGQATWLLRRSKKVL